MEVVGSVDQGTQSTKFSLYDKQLNVICTAIAEHTQYVPKNGWSEHDPLQILNHTYDVMARCILETNKKVGEVKVLAIGITNQRETIVVWDKYSGKPLYNAIVWQDTRTVSMVDKLIKTWSGVDAFRDITGLPINTYFSAVKIKWLMEEETGIAEAINNGNALVGTIDSWLVWNLTGGIDGGIHVTDITNASRTFLMDIRSCQWSDLLLKEFQIPRKCLPKICSCSEIYGFIKTNMLPENFRGVPISGIAGDQQASCVGHGVFSVGKMKCTFGTGVFILVNTGEEIIISKKGLLTTPCYKIGPDAAVMWSLEGSIATAGSGISWLKDRLHMISSDEETEALLDITEEDNTASVVFVPAFSGLFAPRWRQDARGCILGLEHGVDRGHIVRALFEAIGFQLNEIKEAIIEDINISKISKIKVDGGMTKNSKFMQLTANIVNCTIEKPSNNEVTSLGAAMLAGLGIKFWSSLEEIESLIFSNIETWEPLISREKRKQKINLWLQGVYRALNWVPAVNKSELQRSSTKDLQQIAMNTANIGITEKNRYTERPRKGCRTVD